MFKRISMMAAATGLAISSLLVPATAPTAVAAGLPDLVVTQWGAASAGPGKGFSFKVKLANEGKAATPRGKTVRFIGALPSGFQITSMQDDSPAVECQFDNEVQIAIEPEWPLFVCASTQPLAPGASMTVLVKAVATNTAGGYHIDVRADDANDIVESNEGNNNLHTPISVQ